MLPAYGPLTAAWMVQWAFVWLSWLVWPLIGWLAWRCVRDRRTIAWRQKVRRVVVLLLALWFAEMRFIEPALIVERHTVLNIGFQARVALISDYHMGLFNSPRFLERVVDRLNAMPLDAVLIAGDHLSKPDRPLAEMLAPWRGCGTRRSRCPATTTSRFPGRRCATSYAARCLRPA